MMTRFHEKRNWYIDEMGYEEEKLIRVLQDTSVQAPEDNWFYVPDCAQLAADTFQCPIAFLDLSQGQSSMYLPLDVFLSDTVPVGILLANRHFQHVRFGIGEKPIPWPPINPQHKPICRRFRLTDFSSIYK